MAAIQSLSDTASVEERARRRHLHTRCGRQQNDCWAEIPAMTELRSNNNRDAGHDNGAFGRSNMSRVDGRDDRVWGSTGRGTGAAVDTIRDRHVAAILLRGRTSLARYDGTEMMLGGLADSRIQSRQLSSVEVQSRAKRGCFTSRHWR